MFGRLWRIGLVGLALACASGTAMANSCRYLEMQLMQLQGSSGRDGELRNVRAMLRNNGCTGEAPAAATSSFGNNFFGNLRRRSERLTARSRQEPSQQTRTQRSAPSGTYRTLCVRRCDGYYFPISFSTTRQHLPTDEAICGQLCPAGDAELFYYSVRSEGPEQMRSVAGKYYADLESAFRYREVLDEACSCGTPLSTPPITAGAATDDVRLASTVRLPARPPRARPAQGIDPETTLNRLGELSYVAARQADAQETVRVILPPWYTMDSGMMASPVPN